MNDYESQRAAKIAKNQALLAELDIKPLATQRESHRQKRKPGDEPPAKKRRLQRDTAPSRTSARLASAPLKPNYTDEPDIKPISLPRSVAAKSSRKNLAAARTLGSIVKEETEPLVPVKDVADVQSGWSDWTAVAPEPTRDANAVFHFGEGYESFTPNKSPEEMLREGVFGGSYFRPLRSRKLGVVVEGDWRELPEAWISGLNVERYLTNPEYDAEINKFHRACGQSIEEWEAAGWISHEHDVRGWFQWYCRFFQGRRCEDDERQISRWRKCVGETGRWKRTLLKQYARAGVKTVEDEDEDDGVDGDQRPGISPVVSQTCLHWAWEVRQDDLDRWYEG
jgi:hypothetical protein